MKYLLNVKNLNSEFVREIQAESKTRILHCYQCGKCSAGCPIANEMEYKPNQIIRMIQLGMEESVLKANTMWLCASCITCTVRCPREIDIAEIMDVLRRYAFKRGIFPAAVADIPVFNRIFLRNIKLFGRLYELGLIGFFNLLTGNPFKDVLLGPKMFFKGKINLIPERIKNASEIKDIFKRSAEIEHSD
ncbi:MAG: 4Fe-4S dicluster domain-containing protein [Elusimicrobia bacterium]|nr:4Fe-4S dicluster domain-containing protein [Elusimicrobiota bacterium]